jgi:hypothetical protein
LADDVFTSEFAWKGVSNDSSVNFLVVQVGSTLHFYNLDAIPVTSEKKSFTLDLTTFVAPFATTGQIATAPVQMASGKGWLFVANPFIDPVVISYDKTSDTISSLRIIIQIRDFDGVSDGLGNEDQPTTLTKEHLYNLRNQGWVSPGIGGVVEGAGTTDPYTAPTGPATTTEEHIDPRQGGRFPNEL